MNEQGLAIAIGDAQTIYATTDPQDQDQLADLAGRDLKIELRETESDVSGHALSDEVLVDVEGHAIALRLPTPADAAALRKALAVGAVTATLVGAGVIASLQSPPQSAVDVPQSHGQTVTINMGPNSPAMRAEQAEALREQAYARAQAAQAASQAAASSGITVPGGALHADQAQQIREQAYANAQPATEATQSDVTVPGPARHADEAEQIREQAYSNQDE